MPEVENINPYTSDHRAKEAQVASMFDAIAPAYDFMNGAMSFGMHNLWQRRLIAAATEGTAPRAGVAPVVLDLATGTGEGALALRRAMPDAAIIGMDISEGMLAQARRKKGAGSIDFRCADALATGLPAASVDVVTIAYGVRNYADIAAGLREMVRVLRPGGKACILELSEPPHFPARQAYRLYTHTLVPLVGRWVSGDHSAYSYLPQSIQACPQRAGMTALMRAAGFASASYCSLCLGACTLYTGLTPP